MYLVESYTKPFSASSNFAILQADNLQGGAELKGEEKKSMCVLRVGNKRGLRKYVDIPHPTDREQTPFHA